MNREEVDQLGLGKGRSTDIPSGKPTDFPVTGLPSHLKAEIKGSPQVGYRYHLMRGAEEYKATHSSPTPEGALEALKKFLNWDPA